MHGSEFCPSVQQTNQPIHQSTNQANQSNKTYKPTKSNQSNKHPSQRINPSIHRSQRGGVLPCLPLTEYHIVNESITSYPTHR